MAQDVVVRGQVTDYEGQKVKNVKVVYGQKIEDFTYTNSQGRYTFQVNLNVLNDIYFKHIAFETTKVIADKKLLKSVYNDTLELNVTMKDIELGVVEVGGTKPDTVVGSEFYSVADFEWLPNGYLVLLTYDKNLKKGSKLRLMDAEMEEIDSYYILEPAVKFEKDFRGNIHLLTEEHLFWIQIKYNRFYVYKENLDFYQRYIGPIIDTIGDHIYYSNYSEVYPAFDYMEFDRADSLYQTLIKVEDEEMMEQYRAEFKFSDVRTKLWAHQLEIQTGIDKEVWVGATVFTNTPYYKPLYAPLMVRHDSVLVFDHYKNYMYTYKPDQGMVDSVEISYHLKARKSGWEQPLVYDKETGLVYALFLRQGYSYLSLIDFKSGEIIHTQKLTYRYIEKLQVINGEVFYIYRPFESIQKKFLYKERLN